MKIDVCPGDDLQTFYPFLQERIEKSCSTFQPRFPETFVHEKKNLNVTC